MVSIAELLDWKPESLGTVADALVRHRKKLVDLQDEIYDAEPPASWISGSASQAGQAHERLRLRLNDMAAEVSDVAINLDDAQARIAAAKRSLEEAVTSARSKGFTVDHQTGVVEDPRTYARHELDQRQDNAALVRGIAADIDTALGQAGDADLDLQKALDAAAQGKVDGGEGSLADAVVQTPTRMDDLTPAQLAELLGDDVAIHSISAFLDAEAELATWEIEGKASADYMVMADGSVRMALHLEAGLGREIEVGGAEADVGAGGTTDLELKFQSVEEAQAFLDGLDDAAFDLSMGDAFSGVAPAVAKNVADYVMEQDISSFRTGVYASGEMEFDHPAASGAAEVRGEGFYDWATDEYGVKLEASADAELGGRDSGYDAAAGLSGEFTVKRVPDGEDEFQMLRLSGELSGTVANERLGLTMPPGTSTGAGVDVQLTVDRDNPAFDDIQAALGDGDLQRAKDLALDNGELVVRQTVIEKLASGEQHWDAKVAEVEYEFGAEAESATRIWYREAGRSEVVEVDPDDLPVRSG